MAFTRDNATADGFWGVKTITYSATGAAAEASPADHWQGQHITIQVTGTLGAGLSIDLQGANDEVPTWAALPTPVTITALGLTRLAAANHGFKHYRFNKTAGHATTDLTITVVTQAI